MDFERPAHNKTFIRTRRNLSGVSISRCPPKAPPWAHLMRSRSASSGLPIRRSEVFRKLRTAPDPPGATVERLREVGGRLLRESWAFRKPSDDFEATG